MSRELASLACPTSPRCLVKVSKLFRRHASERIRIQSRWAGFAFSASKPRAAIPITAL